MSTTIRTLMTKYGVDISQYTTQINELKNQQTQVENKFRTSANAMDNWQSTSQGLALRVSTLNEKINLQRQILNNLEAEYNEVKAAAGNDSEATLKLQRDYNNASKVLDNMNKELDSVRDELYKVAIAEGKTGDEAKEMGGKLKSAAQDTNSIKGQVKDFALSSVGQFATVAGAVGLAKEAFQKLAELITQSAQWADDISTFSKTVNISVGELQELQYTSKFVDVDVDTMAKGIQRLTRSMYEANNGNKELNSILKEQLGVDYVVNGQLRDKQEVFYDVIEALGKMTNETERDAIAQKLMGRSAAELNPLIVEGKEALKKYGDEAHSVGAVVDRGTIAVLNRLQDKMDQTAAITEAAGKRFAASMAPVTSAIDTAWQAVVKFTSEEETLIRNQQLFMGLSREEAEKNTAAYYRLMEAYNVMGLSQEEFGAKLKELYELYRGEGQDATAAYNSAVETLAQGMDAQALATQRAKEKQDEFMAKMEEYDVKIKEAMEEYKKSNEEYTKAVESTTEKYLNQMGTVFDQFDVKTDTSKKKLKELKKELVKNLDEQVEAFQTWSDDIGKLSKRGVDDGLINELRQIGVKALPQVQALNTMTDDELKKYVETWRTKQKLAKDEAIKELEPMKQEVVNKIKVVEEAISEQEKYFRQAGKDLGGGVADGINDSTPAIVREAREAAREALKAAKKELGIASHSKVARDEIGMNYGGGIADGIVISLDAARARMQKSLNNFAGLNVNAEIYKLGSVKATQSASAVKTGSTHRSASPPKGIPIEIPLIINGKEFARATVDDISQLQAAKTAGYSRAGGRK
jgi:hypothetical protein